MPIPFAVGRPGSSAGPRSTGVCRGPSALATVNENVPSGAPMMRAPVRTVTCSPSWNRRSGVKTLPGSERSAWTRPVCGPLTDPVTSMLPTSAPVKVMLVCGDATRQPGPG